VERKGIGDGWSMREGFLGGYVRVKRFNRKERKVLRKEKKEFLIGRGRKRGEGSCGKAWGGLTT
jgi:Fe-S cluster biosynthesis and repair protein YggX